MSSLPIARMSYAEYVAFEASSDARHEYLNGEIFAMSGGTPRHAELAAAMSIALGNALRDRSCSVYSSDLRIRVKATGLSTYPDISVICERRETDPDDSNALINPSLVVEVLSPTTEAYDRGAKAAHYRRIPSLREYVLMSQDEPLIEVYRRNERGNWELVAEAKRGEQITLEACGAPVTLDVDAIYRDPLA